MTVVAALVLCPLALAGLVGVAVSMVELARLGRELFGVPLHARLNPFNHAARPHTETSAMRAANGRGVSADLYSLVRYCFSSRSCSSLAVGRPLLQTVRCRKRHVTE
jgi:hypothetical protein